MTENTGQIHQTDHRPAKGRTSILVLVSPKFKTFLEDTVKQIGYSTMSEFIRDAIRRRLEALGFDTDRLLLTSGVEETIE